MTVTRNGKELIEGVDYRIIDNGPKQKIVFIKEFTEGEDAPSEQDELWDEDFIYGVNILLQEKPRDKSIFKASEELMELGAKLMQYANKGEDNGINEEIVDVSMHIYLLSKMFGVSKKDIRNKVDKFLSSPDYKKYLQQSITRKP